MSSSGDSGPGQREVAYRLFAAEFDDSSLSYAESDDERAPNYVVTPTGLRLNRLFAVGVLTETEAVNDETLRGRIVDPTGAFVTYAGQYQPPAQAFLDRTTPPAFVAITGKARTFEPEDADRVFTSVRPESLSEVEATTRDRWVVSAAEATLKRIAICAAALDSPLAGEELQHALADAGVDDSLAAGIPRAIDHYNTTSGYLAALRQLAVDALEVVADERQEVRPLGVAPDEGGEVAVGPLPSVALDLDQLQTARQPSGPESTEVPESEAESPAETSTQSDDTAEIASADTDSPTAVSSDTESADSTEPSASVSTDSTASTSTTETTDTETVEKSTVIEETDATGVADTDTVAENADTEANPAQDAGSTTAEPDSGSKTEPAADEPTEAGMYQLDDQERAELESEYDTGFSSGNEVDPAGEAGIDVPDADELAEQAERADQDTPETADPSSQTDSPAGADTAEPTPTATDEGDESLGSFEDELGGFGDETTATEASAEPTGSSGEASTESAEPDSPAEESTTNTTESAEPDSTTDESTEEAAETANEASSDAVTEDIDLEGAVVEVMAELDDGDGVEHADLIDEIIDRYGVDETPIEEAIADALMGGRCYETGDDTLKAI